MVNWNLRVMGPLRCNLMLWKKDIALFEAYCSEKGIKFDKYWQQRIKNTPAWWLWIPLLPLQGYYAAARELADCAVRERGSDPDDHGSLWGPDCGCDRDLHSGCCHSQSGARNVVRAGCQASHVGGWCRRGSPWKALSERDRPSSLKHIVIDHTGRQS